MNTMQSFSSYLGQASRAASHLASRGIDPVDVVITCGSGIASLADGVLPQALRVPLDEIPGLPVATVTGHGKEAVYGRVGNVSVMFFTGRIHVYEGHSSAMAGFPAAIAKELGAKLFIATNAAGSLSRHLALGSIMVHRDFINNQHENPLEHLEFEDPTDRFVDPNPAYNLLISGVLENHLRSAALSTLSGTYVAVRGPIYETNAELAMLSSWGADCVGMSTVPEVIVSHLMKLPVVALSIVTNQCFSQGSVSHDEVVCASQQSAPAISQALRAFLGDPSWITML